MGEGAVRQVPADVGGQGVARPVRRRPTGALVTVAVATAVAACGPVGGSGRTGSAVSAAVPACSGGPGARPLCGPAAATYLSVAKSGWGGILTSVRASVAPVYLPTWTPAPPVGACVGYAGTSAVDTYEADMWFGPCAGATPAPSATPRPAPTSTTQWSISGGAPGSLGPSPVVSPGGTGQPVVLAPGVEARCYPGASQASPSVLEWQEGGWRYQVVDGASCNGGAGPLLQPARRLVSAEGRGPTPVPAMSAGTVVDIVAGDQTSISVVWQVDQWQYRVEGPDASALSMAASVVHVAMPGAG